MHLIPYFWISQYSYGAIFIALGLGIVGLPIPDETLMAYAGFLVFRGTLDPYGVVAAAFAGTSCGITLGYLLGRTLGHPFLNRYARKTGMDRERIEKAESFYNRYGKFALFFGYFVPGVRHLTALMAGTSLMPYRVFAAFAYAGGFLWTLVLVGLGYLLGEQWHHVYMVSHRYGIPLVLLGAVLVIAVFYRRMADRKGSESS